MYINATTPHITALPMPQPALQPHPNPGALLCGVTDLSQLLKRPGAASWRVRS